MADNDSHATIARLADEVVPALIERLAGSELGELEVREDGWRIRLRRPSDDNHDAPVQPAPGISVTTSVSTGAASQPAPRDGGRGLVTAPAVGYFTPLGGLEAGASVRSGDRIGHIDVLGVRHEVVSAVSGALRAYEVQSGEAVEFGQAIARVDAEA